MNRSSTDILNDLVAATREGIDFYEHAATRVRDNELRALFFRIAKVKGEIVQGLADEFRLGRDRPAEAETGTWAGDFDRFYTAVRGHLADRNYADVARLEESEEQLFKAFFRAIDDAEAPIHARTVVSRLLPEVRQCQLQMHAQQVALKKAA